MICGFVSPGAVATVEIAIEGADGNDVQIEVVVDTGFDGDLLLPTSLIQQLQLQKLGDREATLADGAIVMYENFVAIVIWDASRSWRRYYRPAKSRCLE